MGRLLSPTLTLDKQKIFQLVSDHREEILKFSVTSLAVFGSAARDELANDSDIDILVELEDITFRNYMGLKFYLEDLFQRKVDLVMKQDIKPRIKENIISEAEYDVENNVTKEAVYNTKPSTLTGLKLLAYEQFPDCDQEAFDYNIDKIVQCATNAGTWTAFKELNW